MPETSQFGRNDLGRLGRQIQLLRQRASLTRSQLAAAGGLSPGSVRDIETGRSSPSLATVVAIADALAITIDELIGAARRAVAAVQTPAGAEADGARTDLTGNLAHPHMRAQTIRVGPDSALTLPERDDAEASFCMVLSGNVAVTLESGATTRLGRGDSFHAAAGVVRSITSFAGESARLLWVASPAPSDIHQQMRTLGQANGRRP